MKHVNKHYDNILSLLETCRTMRELKQLHGLMITTSVIKDIIPLRKLIDFCATRESGNLNYAKSVFSQIHRPSINIWNSMIKGYSKSDTPHETFFLYREMLQRGHPPDHFTYPFVLKACSIVYDVEFGMCIHNHVLKTGFEVNVYVSTCLLNLYVSCEDMKSGLQVFDKIPKWNVVAWTSLIAGYVNSDCACEAIKVFKDMENFNVEPNEITMTNVLIASSRSRDLATGKWAHNRVCELGYDPFESRSSRDAILATAIFDMYAKCGCLKVARDLFNKLPRRKLVAWNSMIAAYNQYGQAEEALGIFSEMRFCGFDPDKATFLSVIGTPAKLGALALGQSLHAYVSKLSIEKDVAIRTALLDMYAKIGDAKTAWRIFQDLQTKDAIAWTSMIMGLAMHGHGEEALSTFKRMQEDPNVTPDQITYIGVLCACSNDGLVEEGKRHFAEMSEIYGILPSIEHYGCMVDLLSRAGRFEEAERLVEQMPFKPDAAVWEALLNGCEIYENVKLANLVRSRMGELEPLAS